LRDKPDARAKELYAALEKPGRWKVLRIRAGLQKQRGVPDALVVSRIGAPRARVHMLELKSPGGQLSKEQIEFAAGWPGCYHVARTAFEADALLNECEDLCR
jgi:hypothetical protein